MTNSGALLFGKTRAAILGLLYGRPDEAFYFQQIRRTIGSAGVGAVQREIKDLLDAGLLERSKKGNLVFYQANRKSPLFPEIRGLVAKTVGWVQALRTALVPLSAKIEVAFVYGSLARGEESSESDIDLLVVGEIELEDLVECLSPVEKSLGREMNPSLYTPTEFRAKLKAGNHFLNAVVKAKKEFLIGDERELGTIRKERVDRA